MNTREIWFIIAKVYFAYIGTIQAYDNAIQKKLAHKDIVVLPIDVVQNVLSPPEHPPAPIFQFSYNSRSTNRPNASTNTNVEWHGAYDLRP